MIGKPLTLVCLDTLQNYAEMEGHAFKMLRRTIWERLNDVGAFTETAQICEFVFSYFYAVPDMLFFSRRHNPLWVCIHSPLARF